MNNEEIKRKLQEGMILPLTSDIIFKAVFIKEEKVLIKILQDVFDLPDYEKPFTILGYETVSPKKKGKTYRGDILVKLSDKSFVTVEMNNRNDESAIDRNFVHLTRIHQQVLKAGEEDINLKKYRLRGLNLNNFKNVTGNPVDNYAICNIQTGKVATMIYSFCNIDLEKCKELVYDINVRNLPKAVRWGALMQEESIEKISMILSDDMLTPEEKEGFLNTMKEVSNDKSILDDWFLDELAKDKLKSQIDYAKEEGIEQGIEQGTLQGEENKEIEIIKKMLNKNYDYNSISDITGKTIEEIKSIEDTM